MAGSKAKKFRLNKTQLLKRLEVSRARAATAVGVGTLSVSEATSVFLKLKQKKATQANLNKAQAIIASNQKNLNCAKSAERAYSSAIHFIELIDCPDQWMLCDPTYLKIPKNLRFLAS